VIGPRSSISERPHLVTFRNPGPGVSDGDGGTTTLWFALDPPTAYCRIRPATGSDAERVAAGTVLTTLSRIVSLPFRPGVTTDTKLEWTDAAGIAHTANVTSVQPDERNVELELIAVEIVVAVPTEDTSWIESGWTET
jgi:hypothetical protein